MAGTFFCHLYLFQEHGRVKLFVGKTSPCGIRKAYEMGVMDSVFSHPVLICQGKIDFIPRACGDRGPKADQGIFGRRGFIGRLDDISPMGTDGVRRISVSKSLRQTGRRFLRNKKRGPSFKGPPSPLIYLGSTAICLG